MRRPPSLNEISKYPVTGGIGVLAVVVTLMWKGNYNIDALLMNGPKLWREPWRLATSALPHGDFFHIAFNLYWTWVFGTLLEKQFGHVKFAALVVFLAAGSAAAQFAVSGGGVGLSGVGYGFFGMLWVISLFDRRFSDAIDQQTIVMFVLWFFLCIVLTELDVLHIANFAHGAGAILAALVGWIYVRRGKRRMLPAAAMVAVLAAIGWGMSVGRTLVNYSIDAGRDYAVEGYNAMEKGRNEEGIWCYRKAIAFRKTDPGWYYNLGLAYWREGQLEEGLSYLTEAARRAPSDQQITHALEHARNELRMEADVES